MSFKTARLVPALFAIGCLTACNGVPKYWSDLGVSSSGAHILEGANDQFLVLVHDGVKAPALIDTCTKAYAPIVAAGFTATFPTPAGDASTVDQSLTKGSDKISITCKVLETGVFVTFRHR